MKKKIQNVVLKKEIKEDEAMNMKSATIFFTIFILSLIANFFQYQDYKILQARDFRKDELLYKWQKKIEYYEENNNYATR